MFLNFHCNLFPIVPNCIIGQKGALDQVMILPEPRMTHIVHEPVGLVGTILGE